MLRSFIEAIPFTAANDTLKPSSAAIRLSDCFRSAAGLLSAWNPNLEAIYCSPRHRNYDQTNLQEHPNKQRSLSALCGLAFGRCTHQNASLVSLSAPGGGV